MGCCVRSEDNIKIAIIGMGYVGLPLAVEFAKKYSVVGFDISRRRIAELQSGLDCTNEVSESDLLNASHLLFTDQKNDLIGVNVFIVTVPTPINDSNQPNFEPLISASNLVGELIRPGDVIIYESTVYPGATEEVCIPRLERASGLILNTDFSVGYSPERINPGDKQHTVRDITKVTSASNPRAALFVDNLYSSVITAGTHLAPSIKVAEAAKVIENIQRDVNIALINELSIIFNRLDIDTYDVLAASATKWNFLRFEPGLVGGHCIGVDPYYMTHKAQAVNVFPQMILAGRRTNELMSEFISAKLIKKMISEGISVSGATVLVLGYTFKENCPDIRNTKVEDLTRQLVEFGMAVDVYDPWFEDSWAVSHEQVKFVSEAQDSAYDAIILTVPHDQFLELGPEAIRCFGKERHVFFDLKSRFQVDDSDLRL